MCARSRISTAQRVKIVQFGGASIGLHGTPRRTESGESSSLQEFLDARALSRVCNTSKRHHAPKWGWAKWVALLGFL